MCDAHPEPIRARESNLGAPATAACPICQLQELRLITYVFGPPAPHGRCVSTAEELAKLNARPDELTAYVVEACVSRARWYHLLRALPVGSSRPPRARASS